MGLELLLHGFGSSRDHVPGEVRLTPLPTGALEVDLDRLDQAAVVVGDHQVHPAQAAALEALEQGTPTGFALAVPDLEPEDLAVPLRGDARGDQRAAGAHPPVLADLEYQGVHQ